MLVCHNHFTRPSNALRLMCFDNEGEPTSATERATTPTFTKPRESTIVPPPGYFSQEQVNTFVAEERRSQREKQITERRALEEKISDLSQRENQTAAQKAELASLAEELKIKNGEFNQILDGRSKEWEREKTKLSSEAETERRRYSEYRKTVELERVASANDAFDNSQIVALLSPYVETRKPSINQDTGEKLPERVVYVDPANGKEVPIDDAVQALMKKSPNLFKSRMKGGVGQYSYPGAVGQNQSIDWNTISPSEYIRLRQEGNHPAVRGLAPKRD